MGKKEIPVQLLQDVNLLAKTVCESSLELTYLEILDKRRGSIQQETDFLHKQVLDDIEIVEDVPGETFLLKNTTTGAFIKISDRNSRGELRGEYLKRLLMSYKDKHPLFTLEQAISQIKSSRNSSVFIVGWQGLSRTHGEDVSPNVIANLTEILIELRKKGITFDKIGDENDKEAAPQLKMMTEILNKVVSLESPRFKEGLSKQIKDLVRAAINFDTIGDQESYAAIRKLRLRLTEAYKNFFAPADPFAENYDKQGVLQFKEACDNALKEAAKEFRVQGVINNVAQFLGKGFSFLLSLLPFESAKAPYRFFKAQSSAEKQLDNLEKEIKQRTSKL